MDCRCSAINSPLIEAKKQQQEEEGLIPKKQLRDPVDKAVFPKPQQRETPDITQALSNPKDIFLIEVLAMFPSPGLCTVTTISNIYCNMFGNQVFHADVAALCIISRAENLTHLNATGRLQHCRLGGIQKGEKKKQKQMK